ncbi:MAG: hypothetical protein ACXWEE_07625, partial [Thermoleophilaceae bacterium]
GAGALIEANRSTVHERLDRVRGSISAGPRAAFDIVPEMLDSEMPEMVMIGWGLSEALCYLRHLELRGEATRLDEADTERWALA